MRILVVSMNGSNEFVECFCWGCGSRWGSGAVVQFVGDGVVVGLVAGDGDSLGQVTKGEPVLFSLVPVTQGWLGGVKNTSTPVLWVRRRWRTIFRPLFQISVSIARPVRPRIRRVSALGLVGFPTQRAELR